jgi:hypothetical protein
MEIRRYARKQELPADRKNGDDFYEFQILSFLIPESPY